MRVVVLGQGVTGYLEAALRSLSQQGVDLFITTPSTTPDTDFSLAGVRSFAEVDTWSTPPNRVELCRRIDSITPDVVIDGGFGALPAYRAVLRSRPPGVLRVMAMDNVWEATLRQRAACLVHRIYLDPIFDCVLVPSDRSEFYAHRLGFHPVDVIRGGYTADVSLFTSAPRSGAELAAAGAFLFAGRLVEHKGVDILAEAYRRYRSRTDQPWDLWVAGIGPLADEVSGVPGVTMKGFVQPVELAELMRAASCFVLPSRTEHYGVVVHEAAASGLPLLISAVAGAVPGLLQDRVNGRVVGDDSPGLWADALHWISQLPADRLEEMSAVSCAVSTRLSPKAWGVNLYEEFEERLQRGGGRYKGGRS